MRENAVAVSLLLAGLLSTAAGCSPAEDDVRARAASDFGCASTKIRVEQLGASTYLATGCGQSDQYTCTMRESYEARERVCER